MTGISSWRRAPRAMLMAGVLAVAALIGIVVANGQSVAHAGAVSQPGYSVLSASAPSGLTVVSSSEEAAKADGPVWFSQPEGPDISTAREVHVSVAGIRVWVAKELNGGICVLATRVGQPGIVGPAASCGKPELLNSGADLESPASSTVPGFIVGVVPDGVSSVSVLGSDDASVTAAVQDNVYAATLGASASSVTFTSTGVQHTIRMGG